MAEPSARLQQRRGILRLAALGLAGLLAACSTVVPRAAPPPPIAPPPVAPRQTIQGALPEDEARSRVAVLVPLSGANAGVGMSIANAANLALLDSGGKRLRITVYDTAGGAAAAAGKAIGEGNRLILGPLLADEVRAVAPVAQRAGVPVIAFSNDSSVAGGGVYLLGFTLGQSLDRVTGYARQRGIVRFAGLMPVSAYGRRAGTDLIRAAEAAGGSVTAMASYDRTPASIAAAVKKLGDKPYDAVLIGDAARGAAQVAPLVRKASPQARILGTELWNTEPTLGATPALRGAWFASVPDDLFDKFAARYRARYGRTPYRLASLGYDGVLLAVKVAADWRPGAPFPAARLLDAEGFAGVDGAFRFGRDGIAQRMLEVQEVAPAGLTTVSPAPRGFGG